MKSRQTRVPGQWLITDERLGADLMKVIRRLPRGSGILIRNHELPPGKRARLIRQIRRIARLRGLQVVDEAEGSIVRVHDAREIRQARLGGARLMMLSPMHATRSHPGWKPLPRMRSAMLARLARMPVIALGGMDSTRFRGLHRIGFSGWAGIDAWVEAATDPL